MARLHYMIVLFITFSIVASEIKDIGWWKNSVFYQIYPRSFKDANNDGIGDLKGITSKLEHFKDAGIDAIWLSPIYASPMVDFGYDISDFRMVHPDYGTDEDFTNLTTRAKQLGLKVILDLVPNHSSDEHEWFKKSFAGDATYRDYYIWKNRTGTSPPNNWISVFGGSAWTCNDTSLNQCYFHQFHWKQPDLNYRNPAVQREMEDVIKYWLGRGVDGFRVDAVPHLYEYEDLRDEPRSNDVNATNQEYEYLDHIYTKDLDETYDLVKSWRKVLDDYASANNESEKVMMTEAYGTIDAVTKYYNFGSHIPFNFRFITDVNRYSSPTEFKYVIDRWLVESDRINGVPNWVMGNHDRPRVETRYPDRGDQMTMLAMILPGVAVTYNGEEIGMTDKSDISWEDTQDPAGCNAGPDKYKEKSRDPNRTPMQWDSSTNAGFNVNATPWIPVNGNYKTVNLAAQKAATESHYKIYQALTSLRRTRESLKSGSTQILMTADKRSMIVLRSTRSESTILVINLSETGNSTVNLAYDIPSYIGDTATVQVASLGSPIKQGASIDVSQNVIIQPKQSLVLLAMTVEDTSGGSGRIELWCLTSAAILSILPSIIFS